MVVPTEEEIEIKGGQRRTVTRKIYPGYVLVDMVLDEETWHAVRNAPGVTGFVGGMGTDPVPLPENELRYILRAPAKGRGAQAQAQDRVPGWPERQGHRWAIHRIHRHGQRDPCQSATR